MMLRKSINRQGKTADLESRSKPQPQASAAVHIVDDNFRQQAFRQMKCLGMPHLMAIQAYQKEK